MSNRNERRGPAHMAGRSNKSREPLRDRYTYEQPPRGQEFEDVESYSSARQKKNDLKELERQKKKKMSRGKKAAIIISVIVLVLLAAGAAAYFYLFGYLLKDLTVEPITKDKAQLGINSQVQTDTSIKNIALFGLDARDDEFEGRSDCIIILSVDNKHGKIKMASVLRDSNVSMRMTDDYGDYYYTDDKITHAYFYGGPELAVNTLNRNFSLDIEDYVTVNFIRLAEIIDACGGVRINITYDEMLEINANLDLQYNESSDAIISDSDYLYEDGDVLLNGNQAVAYARIRHLDSDDMRASRQQNVLKALLEQARGKSKLEYPEMIRKLMPMCKTSLDFTDIVSLVPIMLTDFQVETISVPGEEESPGGGMNSRGGWVYLYDLEVAARHINRFIYEQNEPSIHLDDHVLEVSYLSTSGGYASSEYVPDPYENEEEPSASSQPPASSALGSEDPNSSAVSSESSDTSSTGSETSGGEGTLSSTVSSEVVSSEAPATGEESSVEMGGDNGTDAGTDVGTDAGGGVGYEEGGTAMEGESVE